MPDRFVHWLPTAQGSTSIVSRLAWFHPIGTVALQPQTESLLLSVVQRTADTETTKQQPPLPVSGYAGKPPIEDGSKRLGKLGVVRVWTLQVPPAHHFHG